MLLRNSAVLLGTSARREQHLAALAQGLLGQQALDVHTQTQAVQPWPSAGKPIEEASTPPSSWYTVPHILKVEEREVFESNWQIVGRTAQVASKGNFFTGAICGSRFIVCRAEDDQLHAYHNVCRHHAAAVVSDSGTVHEFECPYHGWQYGLDGRLRRATRLKGIKDFKASECRLAPIRLDTWGPFVFLRLRDGEASSGQAAPSVREWLGAGGKAMLDAGIGDGLVHIRSQEYYIGCNWKVFCDNYLDGGYHVPFAHKALAGGLDLKTYSNRVYETVSIQSVAAAADPSRRLTGGRDAAYAFVYPNLMINRYGPWMDTNVVVAVGHDACRVTFDYFLDPARMAESAEFVEDCVTASDGVQQEDIALCEGVQGGLSSAAYDTGRYAPSVETPMFHFHQLLHADLMRGENAAA